MPTFTPIEIKDRLHALPGWKSGKLTISKKYTFPGFKECIAFVDRVAKQSIANNHHPDIDIRYDKATIRLSTHDEGGVTDKDFTLAGDIDKLHSER